MPAPSLDPNVMVFDSGITIKFDKSLRVSSVLNAVYQLFTNGATPVFGSFSPIDLAGDYNSISRTLDLHFATGLISNTSYIVRITGLVDSAGNALPYPTGVYNLQFMTNPSAVVVEPPAQEPVYVVDHSIRTDAYTSFETIIASNPNFYVVTTDPDLSMPILDAAYNNGRITIVFSSMVSSGFLTLAYFKAQTKTLERGRAQWINVPGVIITADPNVPSVYLDFPSIDATPVFNTSGHDYFIAGNKYRIKLDKSIAGNPAGATVLPSSSSFSQSFVFVQPAPMITWVIRHEMNTHPSVQVVDSLGNIVIGDIQYIDLNVLTITFSVPFAGSAYLN